jgi:hypothetical protein
MTQIEIRALELRVGGILLQVYDHTQQLERMGPALEDLEEGWVVDDRNFRHQVGVLEDEVRLLSRQVRELMRWEPWLLRVYRWWYGLATPA